MPRAVLEGCKLSYGIVGDKRGGIGESLLFLFAEPLVGQEVVQHAKWFSVYANVGLF